jgi:hypothetical protein
MSRKRTPDETEAAVLIASRRRCALCYGLVGDIDQKRGQIAHVDRDPSNADFDNLAFLCLPHHDEYDSKTSQSKRFTLSELITYRKKLYDRISQGLDDRASPSEVVQRASPAATAPHAEAAPFFTLVSGSFSAGVMDFHVRNDGQPVTVLAFETTTHGAHIRQWYPTSLPTSEVLRATVLHDHPEPEVCVFQIHLRDRAGLKRTFELRLDRASSPQRFDFFEPRDADTTEELLPEYERIVLLYLGENRIAEEERLTKYLESLGFAKIAYTIAVQALTRKGLIEVMPSLDPIPAHILYHLTDAGMRWLLEHPEQLIVRKSAG